MKQKNNEGYVKQRHYTLYDWEYETFEDVLKLHKH